MQIKAPDDRNPDLSLLRGLLNRADLPAATRDAIDWEIRAIQSGLRAEQDAAYEIEFHYGNSRNWVSIHDLRIECEGRVAQIDHLLVNRALDIYVLESKNFAEGVAINESGEFTAFYSRRPRGMPSPLEQNRRHVAVLKSVFKTGQVSLPRRLGFAIQPNFHSLVLVSRNARISRPKRRIDGIDSIIKNDQLHARITRDIETDNNFLLAAKFVGHETLDAFARNLAGQHRPLRIDWFARFGVRDQVATKQPASNRNTCAACGAGVSFAVAKFCWTYKGRFGGSVYCMECQKTVAGTT